MTDYSTTKSRILQWIGIILIIGVFAGAYWYFQVRAGYKTNSAQTNSLAKGLVGYWPLDNGSGTSATDASTNGNTGTLTNGPTWTTGQIGGAVHFDGTNDYITAPDNAVYAVAKNVSYSVWIKLDSIPGTFATIFRKTQGGAEDKQMGITSAGKVQFLIWNSTDWWNNPIVSNAVLSTGTWYHLVGTYDGISAKLYINDVLDSTLAVTHDAGDGIGAFVMGYDSNIGYYFPGSLDEMRIYDRTLSADEVAQLYRLASPTGVDTSLKGYWSFNGDDLSGTTAYDRSGSGNNGTLTNSPVPIQGKVGQALDFDGGNSTGADHVAISDSNSLDMTTNWSVGVWVNFDTFYTDTCLNNILVSKDTDASNGFYGLGVGDTGGCGAATGIKLASFGVRFSDGTSSATTGVSHLQTGTWYYILGTYDGAALKIYVNGVLEGSTAIVKTPANSSGALIIGKMNGASSFNYGVDGKIDEVRIYSRALSAAEIQSLYTAGQSDEVNTGASQAQGTGRLDSGLAGYWKLDDGSGTSATDSSTNGNTGTLTNGPTWTMGQIGGAVDFDGTDDYITVTDSDDSKYIGDLTLCVWAKIDTGGAYRQFIGKHTANGSIDNPFDFRTDNSATPKLTLARSNASTNRTWEGPTVTLGQWKHYCVVASATIETSVTFYVDGAVTTGTSVGGGATGAATGSGAAIRIGSRADGVAKMDGSMDEIRIYSRKLSADEVAQLYRLTTPTGTDTSLKGYWSFNGKDLSGTTAYDRSGSGNNGTLINGPTKTQGKIGQALNFWPNGADTNAYVDAGDPGSGALDFGSGDFSVGFWMKGNGYTAQGSSSNSPVSKHNYDSGSQTAGYSFFYSSPNLMNFIIGNNTTAYAAAQTVSTVADNQWHHYIGERSGNTIYLYVDGSLVASTAVSGSVTNGESFLVGANGTVADRNINGSVDEVRVYNRALSAAEIQAQYAAGQSDEINTGASQAQGTGRLDSGLAGYWKFDDGSGTSATDSSTNGNTGTLTNGPTWTTGQIGGGVSFDNSNDYITAGDPSNGSLDPAIISVASWFKLSVVSDTSSNTSYIDEIVSKDLDCCTDEGGYSLLSDGYGRFSSLRGQIRLNSNGNQLLAYGSTALQANTWYHGVMVFDGTKITMYLNGAKDGVSSTVAADTVKASSNSLFIGSVSKFGPAYVTNGAIDEVRIYNRALSADEVSQLYRLTSPTSVDTSLKGYWSFNGKDISGTTAADRSGAGNNGTLTNGPTVTPGKLGQALSFDGSDDVVTSVANNSSLAGLTQASVAFWMKPRQFSDGNGGIFSTLSSNGGGNGAFVSGFEISRDEWNGTNKIRLAVDGSTGDMQTSSSSTISINEWTHVVVVWDGSLTAANTKFYFNGALVGTTGMVNGSGSYVPTSGNFRIGFGPGGLPFNGLLDEVRVYNRQLSATEVAALYNASK